jgi:amino acid permease
MAGNCLVFGIRAVQAAGYVSTEHNSAVRGIAVGAATFACLIHIFSRRAGIWLGNLFAIIKVLMLTMMVIIGFCAWGGAFKTETYATQNMAAQNAFKDPASEPYGYVKAFLSVIFAWSGFDQPTYVSLNPAGDWGQV